LGHNRTPQRRQLTPTPLQLTTDQAILGSITLMVDWPWVRGPITLTIMQTSKSTRKVTQNPGRLVLPTATHRPCPTCPLRGLSESVSRPSEHLSASSLFRPSAGKKNPCCSPPTPAKCPYMPEVPSNSNILRGHNKVATKSGPKKDRGDRPAEGSWKSRTTYGWDAPQELPAVPTQCPAANVHHFRPT